MSGFATHQPTETVTRPEPGIARGKWEAPPWAFWLALAVVLVGTTLYVLRRMGVLRLKTSSLSSPSARHAAPSPNHPPTGSDAGAGPKA